MQNNLRQIYTERSILGAIIDHPEVIPRVAAEFDADNFTKPTLKSLYELILKMHENGKAIDVVTLAKEQEDHSRTNMINMTVESSFVNLPFDMRWLQREKNLKDLKLLAAGISQETEKGIDDLEDYVDEILEKLRQIKMSGHQSSVLTGAEVYEKAQAEYDRALKGEIVAMPTGIYNLDRYLGGGFFSGELIILGALTRTGKTAFALTIAEHLVLERKIPILIFSFEMRDVEIFNRLVSQLSESLTVNDIRRGAKEDNLVDQFTKNSLRIVNSDIHFASDNVNDIRSIEKHISDEIVKHGIKFVVIDHLQLVKSPKKENATQEMTYIANELKRMSLKYNIPILALSQFSRFKEGDRSPRLSDLKQSGAIEQAADVVLLLYRKNSDEILDNEASLAIAKQRHGGQAKIKLMFIPHKTRFEMKYFNSQE